jgi:Ca2+-binding RTX toxin-like protein
MKGRGMLAAAAACAALFGSATAAQAALIVPDRFDEDPMGTGCSLREALTSANANANTSGCVGTGGYGSDQISLPPGTYTLTTSGDGENGNVSGDLDVFSGAVTIENAGDGPVTIDASGFAANDEDRILNVLAGGTAVLRGLTLTGGVSHVQGGAIYNLGSLVVASSTLTGNSSAFFGGAIANEQSLSLANVTISGNETGGSGGGIHQQVNTAFTGIASATIVDNSADLNGPLGGDDSGGGIAITNGTAELRETIVAGNTDLSNGSVFAPDCWEFTISGGQTVSLGHNLVGNDANCGLTAQTGDQLDVDPLLAPLADNGGINGFTHKLLVNSPALNAASGPPCLQTVDQRGVARPQGTGCDIGAFERAPSDDDPKPPPPPPPPPPDTQICAGLKATLAGTPGPDTITGTPAADVIAALGGNDRVLGLAGNDVVCGGPGSDRLSGGAGNDRLLGQSGKDRLTGGAGRDTLRGAGGKDRCAGGGGRDRARGCERRTGTP